MNVPQMQILLVEDEVERASALAFAIESDPRYQVAWAASAEEGIKILRGTPRPVFVISDVNLEEDRAGFDVAAIATALKIPVLVVTDRDTAEKDKSLAALEGTIRYFRKPLEADALLHVMNDMLNMAGALDMIYKLSDQIKFDRLNEILIVEGKSVPIGPVAAQMLKIFLDNQDRPVATARLALLVYGVDDRYSKKATHAAINRLRKKVEKYQIPLAFEISRGRGSHGFTFHIEGEHGYE